MEEKKLTGYPSIDKPWLKYYSEEAVTAPLPECTIYEYLWKCNKNHLNDIAEDFFARMYTILQFLIGAVKHRDCKSPEMWIIEF